MADTRQRLLDTALGLFEARGYDHVSVSDVAAAAGVGERTVYRYFPTKEALVLDEQPGAFDDFVAALNATPPDVDLLDALSLTLRSFAPAAGTEATEARRAQLLGTTPTLHRAWMAALDQLEPALRTWLAGRTGRDADDLALRTATAALLGVHRMLVETWDGDDMAEYLDRADAALGVLADGLRALDRRRQRRR